MSAQNAHANDDYDGDYDDLIGWVDIATDDFIAAIFADVLDGMPTEARAGTPVMVNIQTARAGVEGSTWQMPWRPGFFADQQPGPWYFCISTSSKVEKSGYARRKKANLVWTTCIVLDDIGTKVERQRVEDMMPPPSWIARTSYRNYQWGYILDRPTDPVAASALLARLARLGLTDPSARDASHVFRVPGSLNLKYDPPVVTKFEQWEPERLYTLAELAAGLPAEGAQASDQAQQGERQRSPDDAVRALKCIKHIKNNERFPHRNDWRDIGMALHDATEGSPEGLAAWIEWTESGNWPSADCETNWASFKVGGGLGLGTLIMYAKQDGYDSRPEEPDIFEAFKTRPDGEGFDGYEEAWSKAKQAAGNGQAGARERFTGIPLADITFDPGAHNWAIDHVLPAEGVALLFARYKSFKSFVALDMALAIARPWVDTWGGRKVKHGVVVYVCAEGQLGFRKRVVANKAKRPDDPSPFYMIEERPDLGWKVGDREALLAGIRRAAGEQPLGLVVIDTVARAIGVADENNEGMQSFLENAEYIGRTLKCPVLGVGHENAAGDDRMRGHTSSGGAAVALLHGRKKKLRGTGEQVCEIAVNAIKDAGEMKIVVYFDKFDFPEPKEGEKRESTLVVRRVEITEEEGEEGAPKSTKQQGEANRAAFMSAFDRALAAHGDYTPNQVWGVLRDHVREEYRIARPDAEADVFRSDFNRQMRSALDRKNLISRGDYVWRPMPGEG